MTQPVGIRLSGAEAEMFQPIELTATLRAAVKIARERSGRAPGAEPTSRERILNAAEMLFGEYGYDVTSLRDIGAKADAATGLIHYHFPTKENLLEEVVARRASIISEIRMTELARLGSSPSLAALLDAFVRPLVELAAGPDQGWASYCSLISLIANSDARSTLIATHLDGVARVYVAALRQAAPDMAENDLLYGFGFTVILMMNVIVKNRRIQTMSDRQLPAENITEIYRRMMKYCVAGMSAFVRTA